MAYNYYPQYYQQNTGMTWVQGETGAKSYMVAPNTTISLWDTEAQKIYIKSADASGMPSMKVLEYKILGGDDPKVVSNELDALRNDLNALREEVNALKEDLE